MPHHRMESFIKCHSKLYPLEILACHSHRINENPMYIYCELSGNCYQIFIMILQNFVMYIVYV